MMNNQNIEYETKVLDIDVESIKNRLIEIGAKEEPEYMMKRVMYDIESKDIEFIRLRQEKGRTTLTYKHKVIGNTTIGGTEEIETIVENFERTRQILNKLRFRRVLYQENLIHEFKWENIVFSIVTWPRVKPYLEIEGGNRTKVEKGLNVLNLTGIDAGDMDVADVCQKYGLDINNVVELKFSSSFRN